MSPGRLSDLSDEELLRRALADPEGSGGRAAASELLGRHQRRVYVWCYRYAGEHERALDLAQDVLLNAYRGLASFGGRSQFSSWLFAITRNRCLNALAGTTVRFEDDDLLESFPSSAGTPEDLAALAQDEARLRAVLARHLDAEESAAMWLQCYERLPVEAIGDVLGLGNATGARALLQRARRKLRAAITRDELREES
jgi:RNA polymerase sigma-70 factor (ECF subfamily)